MKVLAAVLLVLAAAFVIGAGLGAAVERSLRGDWP